MSVRKQIVQETTNVPTEIISDDDDTQELEAVDHQDGKDEFSFPSSSSSRNTRRRERGNQSQPREMTEEEMMELALRLSEQEASHTALQLQREEDAVRKAIQESKQNRLHGSRFINRHGPGSKRPLPSEPSLHMVVPCSNGTRTQPANQEVSRDARTPQIHLSHETRGAGEETKNRSKKRKRKEGIPLETSDVSTAMESQASPQSSDSTVDLSPPHKSPVFLSADCRALVQVPRLSQDLLDTCRSSGFVLCSQDRSPPRTSAQPTSPTFPRSPGNLAAPGPKSPASLPGDDEETQLTPSPEGFRSPVFGRSSQRACRTLARVCETPGLEVSSSEESVTSSVRTTPARPHSPVFPGSHAPSPPPPPERSPTCSPVFSETHRGPSPSPVFGRRGRQVGADQLETSVVPSEVERSNSGVSRAVGEESSQRSTQPGSTEPHQEHVGWNRIPGTSRSEGSQETPADLKPAETEPTSDMTLVWSDNDEDVTPAGSPSPVFPQEGGAGRAEARVSSLNHDSADSPGAERRSSSAEPQPGGSGGACAPPGGGPTVQYHWGVPFCPRGLDPVAYTQVILAQMNVYDTSLRQAQRRLLRKAPWGDAILPQPEKSPSPESFAESPPRVVLRRRGLRLRKTNESEEFPPAEEEEEEGGERRDEEEETEKQKSEGGGGEEKMDTDDCDVCPETQLSNNDDEETQDLTSGAELRPEAPDLPEVQTIPRADPPAAVEEDKEEMEVDAAVCGSKEGNIPARRPPQREEEGTEDGVHPDVEEVKVRQLRRPTPPEVAPGGPPPRPEASVACPMCQGSFPVARIERHAAFCDGDVSVLEEEEPGVASKPRRKRRRAEVPEAEETSDAASSSRNQEKCFLCQKTFPLREYTRHTELCLQRRTQKSETRGDLLSALEQTEARGSEAGPSGTRVQPAEVIDLRDDDEDDEEEDGVRALRVSGSPIRSFTPISEATGCLIDFRRPQRARKPSHRRR